MPSPCAMLAGLWSAKWRQPRDRARSVLSCRSIRWGCPEVEPASVCRGVAQDRRPSQICRLERAAGPNIIAPRRTSSAHLHRPWRATRSPNLPLLCYCLRGRSSPALSRRSNQRFRRNGPLAVQLPGHSHRERTFPGQNIGCALARAEQPAKISLGIATCFHAVTDRIDCIGRLDRPALALIIFYD